MTCTGFGETQCITCPYRAEPVNGRCPREIGYPEVITGIVVGPGLVITPLAILAFFLDKVIAGANKK